MGRRPKLKSEEFFISTILGVKIIANLCLKPLKKCYTVREHDPEASSLTAIKYREAVRITGLVLRSVRITGLVLRSVRIAARVLTAVGIVA